MGRRFRQCAARPGLRWRARVGAVIAMLVLTTACSSSPTNPSGASSLIVTGPTTLTPGLMVQLTATGPGGTPVTASVSWQSSTPSVATVSGTGVVTAVAPGSATITASDASATGRLFMSVQAVNQTTTTLSACGLIALPGQYVLARDLTSTGVCLTISNTASVQLDCAAHKVPAGVGTAVALAIANAVGVSVTGCAVTGQLTITSAQNVTVADTTIAVSGPTTAVDVEQGTNVLFTRDTIAISGSNAIVGIAFQNGSYNQVFQSTLSGQYDGGKLNVGADDGILLTNETADDIENNVIQNFYDAGVEGVDALSSTTIAGNTFRNMGFAAVGSYWCTNWTGNVVRRNNVSGTPLLADVLYKTASAQCGAMPAVAGFVNNQFLGNSFRSPSGGTLGGPGGPTMPTGPSMAISMSGTVMGNVLANNDFGTNPGPNLVPLSGFVDGGGNICGPQDPTVSNFPCSGSSGSANASVPSVPLMPLLIQPHGRARALQWP
jgi:Bacterial Ig-like domain (group 2)/Periplasmic copper-binding protein (NosD)